MGGAEARLTLASTSPQRRAILEQLAIPFEVVPPDYVEEDPPDADAVELVRRHAEGKARSVHVAGRITLGVDTTVLARRPRLRQGRRSGRRGADAPRAFGAHACSRVGRLPSRRRGGRVLHDRTDVTFRSLSADVVDAYLESGEWEGRAGAYAIQGLGGRLVERIEGDYLNVVGLPGALLVSILERRAPKLLQTPR